jgi:dienelactone hydrolase
MSIARANADKWALDKNRVGVLGFSAGGHAAAHVAVQHDKRSYEAVDDTDKTKFRPDFAILVYAGGLIDDKTGELKPDFAATKETPPTILFHAYDDGVTCNHSVQMFVGLKKAGVPSELHVYDAGHGFNRDVDPRHHDPASARLAHVRTLDFLQRAFLARPGH